MARWTLAHKLAHSARIKALRALGAAGPYAQHSAKLALAHAEGRHPGFGARGKMTDGERREAGRLATLRYRLRKAGKSIPRSAYPARPVWPSISEACKRLDALLRRSADVGHDALRGFQGLAGIRIQREVHPLECLWRPDRVTYVRVLDEPQYRRDLRTDPIICHGFATEWKDVHAARRMGKLARPGLAREERNDELAALVAEQQADASANAEVRAS